jgi:autotransporter-associated beta strand protein
MKPKSMSLRVVLALTGAAILSFFTQASAATYTWDSANVTGTPTSTLDWFTGGSNALGLWTGAAVPVSASDTTIQFFANTTTSLPNTAVPSTQTVNLNNGGSAFQLGTLALNGFGSATSGASLTMTLQGDALNFSGATGTISFNSVKNVAPATDPVINYNINNNIQLGTAGSASALTLTGNGDNSGTTTYNINSSISELQAGGGSIIKSGTSTVNIIGAINITGAMTVSAGILNLTSSTNTASSMTVNGGTLILTGALNPASASMTVNTGGILRIGNNTATQFGPSGVYSGNISTGTGGTLQLWSSSTQELSGVISGSGGINKAYAGTLTLSGLNTYTGQSVFKPQNTAGFTVNVSSFDYITSGTYANHGLGSSLGAPTTVANGTIDVGSITAQAGTTLNYTGSGETTDRVLNFAGNASSTSSITTSGSGLLKFTSNVTVTPLVKIALGGNGDGEISGNIGVTSGALTKSGNGTWTLSGTNGITGATTISAGILRLSNATALQDSPFNTASVAGGAAAGLRIETTTLSLGGLTGANPLKGRFTTALGGPSNATAQGGYEGLTNLTLNTVAGSNLAYTGAIVEGATGMTLTKTGAGIQTLGLGNTYTGTTFVNGGLLSLTGNTLAGGLSVSNASLLSNSTFAGLATVNSGGVYAPGASLGSIGTLTINNASASALTLGGSTGIFDLPSTVTTPDQVAITGGGGLVLSGTNGVVLNTSTTGTQAGVYTLMTYAGAPTGGGSLVFAANGSTTRGNATLAVNSGSVTLTVAAGGLAGTTTFNGAGATGNTNNWSTTARWNTGVVPTGTTNITLAPTGTQGVTANDALVPTYSGDLMINPGVTLQIGWTTTIALAYNALGTPGSTIIFMGAGSQIKSRNAGTPTFSDIVLLGDASISLGESTQTGAAATFNSITGPYAFSLYTHGIGGAAGSANLTAANSFTTLNLSGSSSAPLTASAANSIGTATVNMSLGVKMILNATGAMADSSNVIRMNNATLEQGTGAGVTSALTLSTRPIELNGAGQATINNNNTSSSSANILTLGGGISSTASGAKTLTLGGTNVGLNSVSGDITDGTGGGTVAVTKANAGTWSLSGANTYTGATTVTAGVLVLDNALALQNSLLDATNSVTGGAAAGLKTTVSTLTLGGLNGTKNLSTLFTTTSGGYGNVTALTLNPGTGQTSSYSGVIADGASGMTLTKTGAGAQVLSGANTYTGATTIQAGTLLLGSNDRLSNSTPVTVAGGTLDISTFTNTVASFSMSSGALNGSGTLTAATYLLTGGTLQANLGAGAVTVNGDVTFSAAGRLNASSSLLIQGGTLTLSGNESVNSFQQTGGTVAGGFAINSATDSDLQSGTFSGNLAGSGGINKTGAGTTTITGTNSYTGATNVTSGTLVVNGNIASSSLTTVASGATIGGSGTVGVLTVSSGAFINPGNSPGILNTGDYTQVGTYSAEITGIVAGTEHDQINVTGTVDITGGSLTTLFSAGTYAENDLIFILLNDGADAITGTYAGLANGALVENFGGFNWTISYFADSTAGPSGSFTGGNDIALRANAIPEPNVAALLGCLGVLLILRRRR